MKFFFNKYDKYGILIDDKKKKKKKKKKKAVVEVSFLLFTDGTVFMCSPTRSQL